MSWRPSLEDPALRQMRGLPPKAFDMLVRTLVRICDDPYDPVFSAPVPPVPDRRVADLGDFGSSSSSPMRQKDWSACITSCGPASDHLSLRSAIPLTANHSTPAGSRPVTRNDGAGRTAVRRCG